MEPLKAPHYDVIVVGGGFAGIFMLYRLKQLGFTARVLEAGSGVGGTWFWNRYPGARCDVESMQYSYQFSDELQQEWDWSERYATQPEILRYANHVVDRFALRDDIELDTRVAKAEFDETAKLWRIETETVGAKRLSARFCIMATGCLSAANTPKLDGLDSFRGPVYHTGQWPHEGVDFSGKRVGIIGTGSSAIQSIPVIAAQAAHVTVFQRTPNFSIPANNGPVPAEKLAALAKGRAEYRESARWSGSGVPNEPGVISALAVADDERLAVYEAAWERGGIIEFLSTYMDHLMNPAANELLAEFVRNKIRAIVTDPETAETLCPKTYPIGTKRLCVDTGYYETFNRPNVRLVDLRSHPIATVTEAGVDLVDESFEFDAIVFATGFDAMTGAIVGVNIEGRNGLTLKDAWSAGPMTYLGLMAADFPNLFMITGPGSPSVLSNMIVSIEQHVDWITDCLQHLRAEGLDTIEPTDEAVAGWVQHVNDFADLTLMPQANSWYMGANVPGKTRVFMPYPGGVDRYRTICNEVTQGSYLGFERRGPNGNRRTDGVVRRIAPDVGIMLEMMATLQLPVMDTMSAVDARSFSNAMSAQRPPGPDVGEIVDGVLPGAGGDLTYRLYRPAQAGPHPIVAYFHGGGWVLGGHDTDDPFCRDLCHRCGAIVISVDYRHAPEARFPAAADDAFAAVQWIAHHAGELGGIADQLAVAGWSAGANLAAVACQTARDAGGPRIVGQLLVNPVTDASMSTGSYTSNADGFILTASLMRWFWDHYTDPADRTNPKASPLLAASLADLPPAVVVTSEFDPLRDEGIAYAKGLAAAGVHVQHVSARGQIHTSLTAVDMLSSGASVRAEMGSALKGFFGASVRV